MNTNTATGTVTRAGRRQWIGLAVLALPTLLLSLDLSVLYMALPNLSADLHADATQQLWITDIYGFMVAGFLVTMGTLGDRIGRRRLLLIGAAAFGVASVLAAYSASAEMLIATRAVLGIAGATLAPSTMSLIMTMFADPKQRAVAIASWVSCFMGGVALGPVIGGAMLSSFWWGSAFLLGVPVMVLLLVTGPILLPEHRNPDAGRLDPASVALSLATILPVIYGLKELAKNGWQPVSVMAVVTGVVVGVVFVRRQLRLTNPLLDVRMFANRTFTAALGIWLLFGAIQGGSYLFINLYLQTVKGFTPLRAGLWLLPSAITMIVATQMSPHVAQRVRPANLIAGGLLLVALGYLPLTQVGHNGGMAVVVIGMVISSFGVGLAAAPGNELILASAPADKAGSAAALSETSVEFGIALGVATLGSLGTAVYRTEVTDNLPAGVPAQAAQSAQESIAGATATAAHLPGQTGAELIEAARTAFVSGFTTITGLAVVLFVALAVVAAVALRQVRPAAPMPEGAETDSGPANVHNLEEAPVPA
jgi:DHA2 family multidrug resistance protein-like MFS transporter